MYTCTVVFTQLPIVVGSRCADEYADLTIEALHLMGAILSGTEVHTFPPSLPHYYHTLTTITPSLLSHHHYYHTITTITPSLLSHHHYYHILTTITPSLLSHPHRAMRPLP